MKRHFDCIIAGGGCAGLSLAYYLIIHGYQGSVLLLDRDKKSGNDRTWCWWTNTSTPFDPFLTFEWPQLEFTDQDSKIHQPLAPYRYCLLRAADFYSFVDQYITSAKNVVQLQVEVLAIEDAATGAIVETTEGFFTSDWVFSSLPSKYEETSTPTHSPLLQHFMGWWIHTEQEQFQTSKATLMDFRVPQQKETRFVYVLPISSQDALIEFTVFSTTLLERSAYETALQVYLKDVLKIKQFQILDQEFGVIPMQMVSSVATAQQHVIPIGTPGGAVKASTGYTFARIQEQTQQIARQLSQGLKPSAQLKRPKRFAFYDRLLLSILYERGELGAGIFSRLFKGVPFPRILKFLDEDTRWWEDLAILGSLPPLPFLRALWSTQCTGWTSGLFGNKFLK